MSKRTCTCGSKNTLQCCSYSSGLCITVKRRKKDCDSDCENYDYGNVAGTVRARPSSIKSEEQKSDEKYNRQRRRRPQHLSRKNSHRQAPPTQPPRQESILFRLLRANNEDNNDGDINILREYEGGRNDILGNGNDGGYDSGFDETLV